MLAVTSRTRHQRTTPFRRTGAFGTTLTAALVVGTLGSAGALAAQRDRRTPPSARPGWLPVSRQFSPGLTAAEKSTVERRLAEIERIVVQVPELARPEGFELEPSVAAVPIFDKPGSLVNSLFQFATYTPTKAVAGADRMVCFQIVVNPHPGGIFLWGQPGYIDDAKGDRWYVEHPFGDKPPGALLAYSDGESPDAAERRHLSATDRSWYLAFFSANGVSPWQEVSRGDYLEALIWNAEGKDAKGAADVRDALTKTRYQRWMEDAPRRKKDREEMLAVVRATNPSQADALRKQQEDTERETAEQLKATEEEDRAENKRILAQGILADPIRAKLAALSPAEKAMPAWTGKSPGLDFLPANSAEAVRIVRPNPEFYQVRTSRIEPRGMMIRFTASLTCHTPPVHRALYQAFRNLDYAALTRLLQADPR
jgi:hypothetical protein